MAERLKRAAAWLGLVTDDRYGDYDDRDESVELTEGISREDLLADGGREDTGNVTKLESRRPAGARSSRPASSRSSTPVRVWLERAWLERADRTVPDRALPHRTLHRPPPSLLGRLTWHESPLSTRGRTTRLG